MKTIETNNIPEDIDNWLQEQIYNGLDSLLTQEIYGVLDQKLVQPYRETYEWERRLLGPVMTMIRRGILLSPQKKKEVVAALEVRKAKVEANLLALCKYVGLDELNPRSYPQIGNLFWNVLCIPKQASVKKGQVKYSLDRDQMEKYAKNYARAMPFANCLMRLRDLEKMHSALTTDLSEDGRWHASFNIGGTDTWRWSSSEHPYGIGANLQNLDDDLRRAFIPDPGNIFFSCDQQGAEARLVGYLSGDENYIAALESGDVHTMVATMTFSFDTSLSPKELRELADRKYYRDYSYRDMCKKLGHGSNYFGKPPTLAKNAKVDVGLAEEFQKQYFRTFPGIPKWHTWVASQIQTVGYLDTPFGDRRHFWDRTWEDDTLRKAIAFVPQSTVGQLTARGLYNIWAALEPEVQILNNIHDAAMGQFPENKVDILMPKVLSCLIQPLNVTDIKGVTRVVVVPWEPSIGHNWGKFHTDKNPDGLKMWQP